MTQVSKILLEFVSAAIILLAQTAGVRAITIPNGSYIESVQTVSAGAGMGQWRLFAFTNTNDAAFSPSDGVLRYLGMSENAPEVLSISETLIRCDFDANGCTAVTSDLTGDKTGMAAGGSGTPTTERAAAGSTGNSTAEPKGISELESLLLLLVGVIGLSRLRGRRID